MLKLTERIGDLELSYEGETVQDIVNLKNAIAPNVLTVKKDPWTKIESDTFTINNFGPISGQECPTNPARICITYKDPDNQSIYIHRDELPKLIEMLKDANR